MDVHPERKQYLSRETESDIHPLESPHVCDNNEPRLVHKFKLLKTTIAALLHYFCAELNTCQ